MHYKVKISDVRLDQVLLPIQEGSSSLKAVRNGDILEFKDTKHASAEEQYAELVTLIKGSKVKLERVEISKDDKKK